MVLRFNCTANRCIWLKYEISETNLSGAAYDSHADMFGNTATDGAGGTNSDLCPRQQPNGRDVGRRGYSAGQSLHLLAVQGCLGVAIEQKVLSGVVEQFRFEDLLICVNI